MQPAGRVSYTLTQAATLITALITLLSFRSSCFLLASFLHHISAKQHWYGCRRLATSGLLHAAKAAAAMATAATAATAWTAAAAAATATATTATAATATVATTAAAAATARYRT